MAFIFPAKPRLGDFLPPAGGSVWRVFAAYLRDHRYQPTGAYTFNRMCSFVMAHLMIFSPGAKLPNWAEVLEGAPKQAMTLTGYQYNVSGHSNARFTAVLQ